ncbi:hypothetical protein DFQ27_003309 [Actinomortierella ambigua]|uniref:Uncharacterized protein n=1 Tax=Actinomortierella ambigua TaxID=1343610 RepID=A0A9P6Q9F8_9FUNG|nr:hypothetical protein DFQ27_003309 [Actinomortierella ambigua]
MSVDTVPETYPTESVSAAGLPLTTQQQQQQQLQSDHQLVDVPMSSPTLSPTPSAEPIAPLKAVVVQPSSPKDTAQSYVLSLRIPASHLASFRRILQESPDPSLVIPLKPRRKNERKRSIVLSSTVRSVSAVPTPAKGYVMVPDQSLSSKSGTKTSLSRTQTDQPDKDPETKMNELMQLKTLRNRQEDLCQLKDHMNQLSQTLEDKETILDEMRSERKQLQNELAHLAHLIKQIQHDLDQATTAEHQLARERDQLSTNLARIRDHDYDKLKQEVDTLRAQHGLRPLPNLEQEREESIGRYLEERRGRWREEGGGDAQSAVAVAVAAAAASASAPATITTSATVAAAGGATGGGESIGEPESASSSSAHPSSSSASRQRGPASRSRDSSQSGRTRSSRTSGSSSGVGGGSGSGGTGRRDHESDGRRSKAPSSSTSSSSVRRRSRSKSPSSSRRNEASSTSSRRYRR